MTFDPCHDCAPCADCGQKTCTSGLHHLPVCPCGLFCAACGEGEKRCEVDAA